MIVLESTVSHVTRNRAFGMIEARVTLFAKTAAGYPPHPVRILTHVPTRGAAPLRERLVGEAIALAAALARKAPRAQILHRAAA